ncbi:MAG: hypothetical protein KGK14_06460, partial [Bacteroidota bacterium]|nr:hypothetical protein [Bacteroidota bacterium]
MNKYFTLSFLLVFITFVLLGFSPGKFIHISNTVIHHSARLTNNHFDEFSLTNNTSYTSKSTNSISYSSSFDSAVVPFSCPAKLIVQNDTTICKGDTVTLTAIKPAHVDSEPPGVWVLLIGS